MFNNSCNLFKYVLVYIITCTSYTLSANTHNYDFTVYNVISSSAKDNSRRVFFLLFFPVKLVTCSTQYFVAHLHLCTSFYISLYYLFLSLYFVEVQ